MGYRDNENRYNGYQQPENHRRFDNGSNGNHYNNEQNDVVKSIKIKAGKRRTYFFDVRRTRGEDFYLTLTESTKRSDDSHVKHKIFVYKEDFNRFLEALQETINYVKENLLQDYDFDEFAKRYQEGSEYNSEQGANHFNGTPPSFNTIESSENPNADLDLL